MTTIASVLSDVARVAAMAAAASMLLAPPALGQTPASPDCAALATERTALQSERVALRRAVADIALGKNRPRRKVAAGDVGRIAAGAAATLLLPFGIGLAVNAVGTAADQAGKSSKKKKKKAASRRAEVSVEALIARQQAVDERLAAIQGAGCPSAPAASPAGG